MEAFFLEKESYVKKIAWRISRCSDFRKCGGAISVEDLYQSGMMGLFDATNRFNPHDERASFKTYALYRIKGAMRDEIKKFTPAGRYSPAIKDGIRFVDTENAMNSLVVMGGCTDTGFMVERLLERIKKMEDGRDKDIFKAIFFDGKSRVSEGRKYNLTGARVGQIVKRFSLEIFQDLL